MAARLLFGSANMKPPIYPEAEAGTRPFGDRSGPVSLLLLAAVCLVIERREREPLLCVRSRPSALRSQEARRARKVRHLLQGTRQRIVNRSKARNGSNFTTRVIVTLKPGTELKPEFKLFVRPPTWT